MGELYAIRPRWETEPDKATWIDDATMLVCHINRALPMGHLCGYVEIPKGHPLHGVDYRNIDQLLDVHGGLTFADRDAPGVANRSGWWLGFDCAHHGDLVPQMLFFSARELGGTYRDFGFVKAQCEALAQQIKRVRPMSLRRRVRAVWNILRSLGRKT